MCIPVRVDTPILFLTLLRYHWTVRTDVEGHGDFLVGLAGGQGGAYH